jgi:hypothetical protein
MVAGLEGLFRHCDALDRLGWHVLMAMESFPGHLVVAPVDACKELEVATSCGKS